MALRFRLPLYALTLVLVASSLIACSTNQATGRSQLNVLSRDEEINIGEEAAPQFLDEGGGPIPDQQIQQYVSNIGQRLAALSERPDLPWEFHTLDSEIINAFALPGGKVFISRGLLSKMNNEAQLAGVLGHEVGHVTAKHINDRMAAQMGVNVAVIAAGAAASFSEEDWMQALGIGAQAGGTLFLLRYSRNQEHESDWLGVRYMVEAGYDPQGQVQVMRILGDASGGGGVEWLQTHPLPQSRVDELQELIDTKYAYTQNNPNFVRNEQAFQTNVLDRLDNLPAPKHPPEEEE